MSSSPSTDHDRFDALLAAAADGRLGDWCPLPAVSVTAVIERHPNLVAEPRLRTLLGQPAQGYRLSPSAAAPVGVIVWSQHDEVTLIECDGPEPASDALAGLGPPAATVASGLGESLEQMLWPDRGLIVHRAPSTGRIARVYGHQPTALSELLTSPLVRVRVDRHPTR